MAGRHVHLGTFSHASEGVLDGFGTIVEHLRWQTSEKINLNE